MTANDLVFSPPVRSKPTSAVRRPGSVPNAVLPSRARLSFLILSPSSLLRPNQVLRHPYGQLPETAPSFVEATQRSEAPPAQAGTGPSPRVGALHRHRRAARFHGGPRAHGVRRNLHRAPSTVLATLAPRHLERHWRCPGVRCDPRIPHVSQGAVHGIPIGSDLGKGDSSKPLRGSGHRGKPGTLSRNGTEPPAASRNASAESGPVTSVVSGPPDCV